MSSFNPYALARGPPMPPLPPGWIATPDPNTGRTYFVNTMTNQTSWTPPQPPPSAAAVPCADCCACPCECKASNGIAAPRPDDPAYEAFVAVQAHLSMGVAGKRTARARPRLSTDSFPRRRGAAAARGLGAAAARRRVAARAHGRVAAPPRRRVQMGRGESARASERPFSSETFADDPAQSRGAAAGARTWFAAPPSPAEYPRRSHGGVESPGPHASH